MALTPGDGLGQIAIGADDRNGRQRLLERQSAAIILQERAALRRAGACGRRVLVAADCRLRDLLQRALRIEVAEACP